jgi:DNA-binding transcriptional LysR family regulator
LEIASRVTDQRLDFGLIRKDAVSPLHVCEPLGTQTYSLFVPIEHLDRKRRNDWQSVVANVPLATISGEGRFRASLEEAAAKVKLRLNFSISCSSFPQAAKALQSGGYAAILPTIAGTELDKSKFATIAPPFLKSQAREICLIWNPRTMNLRPGTEVVKNHLAKLLRLPKTHI